MPSVEERLARLEREVRLWRRLAALVAALVAAALLVGLAGPAVAETWGAPSLEGYGFSLKYAPTGTEVGRWTVFSDGGSGLWLTLPRPNPNDEWAAVVLRAELQGLT